MVRIRFIAGVVAALATVAQVSAGFVDVTQGYNVLTFGDFTSSKDAIHGKLATGNNVTLLRNAANSDKTQNELYSIVAGGNIIADGTGGGSQIDGNVYAAGDASFKYITVNGNIYANNVRYTDYGFKDTIFYTNRVSTENWDRKTVKLSTLPELPINFASTQTAALALSADLAQFGANDYSVSSSGTLYFNDQAGDVNYYTVDASDLRNITSLHFDNLNEQYVINVNGNGGAVALRDIDMKNYGTNQNFNFSNVLFNFVNTSTLDIGGFYGNLLAANTNVTAEKGQMFGRFVANSFSGMYQFHDIQPGDFTPPPTPPQDVPEGSTSVMMIAGVLMLIVVSRKKISFSRK